MSFSAVEENLTNSSRSWIFLNEDPPETSGNIDPPDASSVDSSGSWTSQIVNLSEAVDSSGSWTSQIVYPPEAVIVEGPSNDVDVEVKDSHSNVDDENEDSDSEVDNEDSNSDLNSYYSYVDSDEKTPEAVEELKAMYEEYKNAEAVAKSLKSFKHIRRSSCGIGFCSDKTCFVYTRSPHLKPDETVVSTLTGEEIENCRINNIDLIYDVVHTRRFSCPVEKTENREKGGYLVPNCVYMEEPVPYSTFPVYWEIFSQNDEKLRGDSKEETEPIESRDDSLPLPEASMPNCEEEVVRKLPLITNETSSLKVGHSLGEPPVRCSSRNIAEFTDIDENTESKVNNLAGTLALFNTNDNKCALDEERLATDDEELSRSDRFKLKEFIVAATLGKPCESLSEEKFLEMISKMSLQFPVNPKGEKEPLIKNLPRPQSPSSLLLRPPPPPAPPDDFALIHLSRPEKLKMRVHQSIGNAKQEKRQKRLAQEQLKVPEQQRTNRYQLSPKPVYAKPPDNVVEAVHDQPDQLQTRFQPQLQLTPRKTTMQPKLNDDTVRYRRQ